jgi:hypothetical protein
MFSCHVISRGDLSRCRADRQARRGPERSLETAGCQHVARAFATGGVLGLARARRRFAGYSGLRSRSDAAAALAEFLVESGSGQPRPAPLGARVASGQLKLSLAAARAALVAACHLGGLLHWRDREPHASRSRSLRAHFPRMHNKRLQLAPELSPSGRRPRCELRSQRPPVVRPPVPVSGLSACGRS